MADPQTDTPEYRFSDDSIMMIRDLVQLSLVTGINVVDQFRLMRFEVKSKDGINILLPEPQYVTQYNEFLSVLTNRLNEMMEQEAKKIDVQAWIKNKLILRGVRKDSFSIYSHVACLRISILDFIIRLLDSFAFYRNLAQ